MTKKWTLILAIVGLIIGIVQPSNRAFGADMASAIAFAVPWAIFFGMVGFAVDYFIRKK